MSTLSFVASLVHSLAWPTSVVAVVVVLRQPIGAALHRLSKARVGPVEAEFDQELAEVRKELTAAPEATALAARPGDVVETLSLPEELSRLAEISPRAAVLEGFTRIEARLHEMLREAGVEVSARSSGPALARLARKHSLISEESLNAIEGLAVMRNLSAHSPGEEISTLRAREYVVLADATLYALHRPPTN